MNSQLRKQDYQRFMNDFVDNISKMYPDVCFYTFGSSNTKDFVCGRSDIDGGIILNSDIVTKKEMLIDIANILADSLLSTGIETQFNLLDLKTIRDGRFLSYTSDYTDFIKEHGRICCGPNLVKEMNGKNFKSGPLYSASFNFSGPGGVRNTLLYSKYHSEIDSSEFTTSIKKALDKVAKFPKKLIWLRQGIIIPSKYSAKKELENMLEDLNIDALEKINKLLDQPNILYDALSNPNKSIKLLSEALECMESMIASYIKHFPQVGERELKE